MNSGDLTKICLRYSPFLNERIFLAEIILGSPASASLNRDDAKDVPVNMKQPQRRTKLRANRVRHTPDGENSSNSSYSTDSSYNPDRANCDLVINENLRKTERPFRKGNEKRLPHVREKSLEKENTIIRFKLSNVSSSSSEPTPSINIQPKSSLKKRNKAVSNDNPADVKPKQKSSSSENKGKRYNNRGSLSQELRAPPERTLGSSPERTLGSIPKLPVGMDSNSDSDLNPLQSRLTQSDLEKIRTTCHIPSNVELRVPSSNDSPYVAPPNGVAVFTEFFHCGPRLPIHPFIHDLLESYNLSLGQLCPNAIWHAATCFVLWQKLGLAITDDASSLEKTSSNSGKVTPQEVKEDKVKPSLSKEAQNRIDTATKADPAVRTRKHMLF
ncbi:hypothetical protein L484_002279 [Morus notabilis]|uniref:Transposase (putative) gypsy type domain-containing protein n=1 Tax=Morus notabilis TaxID=981085 RepID=W9RWA7_9ROSA|nr:hypothetical protein L484_002279 [Morus notabilis]